MYLSRWAKDHGMHPKTAITKYKQGLLPPHIVVHVSKTKKGKPSYHVIEEDAAKIMRRIERKLDAVMRLLNPLHRKSDYIGE